MGRDSVSLDRRRRTTALVLRVGPRQPEVAWACVRKVIQDVRLAKDGSGQVEDRDRNATPQAASGTETHSAPDGSAYASRSVRFSMEPGTECGRQASASCRPCRTTLQFRPGLEDHANDGGGRDSGETGDRPGRCQARQGTGGHRTRLLRDYRPCMRPVNRASSSSGGRWSTPAGAVSPDDAGEVRALPPLDDFSPGARSGKNLGLLHSQASMGTGAGDCSLCGLPQLAALPRRRTSTSGGRRFWRAARRSNDRRWRRGAGSTRSRYRRPRDGRGRRLVSSMGAPIHLTPMDTIHVGSAAARPPVVGTEAEKGVPSATGDLHLSQRVGCLNRGWTMRRTPWLHGRLTSRPSN